MATIAGLLPPGRVALRGSSMGGYLAIVAAERVGAAAVVAICPASADGLLCGLRAGAFTFRADRPSLEATELIAVPGGHHRSVQHDAELQARSLRWLGAVV